MTTEQTTRKCAHAGCLCEVAQGQTYCGLYCAAAGAAIAQHDSPRCGCGHAACSDAGRREGPPAGHA